jgi:hypothetical protein
MTDKDPDSGMGLKEMVTQSGNGPARKQVAVQLALTWPTPTYPIFNRPTSTTVGGEGLKLPVPEKGTKINSNTTGDNSMAMVIGSTVSAVENRHSKQMEEAGGVGRYCE